MCLAVPGKVRQISEQDGLVMGQVEFGGILKDVCLAYTPEATIGDYVIVHVGFAISVLDEVEAKETLSCLEQLGQAGNE